MTLPRGNPQAAISYALKQLGKPYVFGAAGPNAFDCSGLTMRAWQHGGVNMGHFTGIQIHTGIAVAKSDLQPGDLVFPNFHHVQLYSGNGRVIEAPEQGIPVREVPMWGFFTARRVAQYTNAVTEVPNAKPGGNTASDVSSSSGDNGSVESAVSWITDGGNWVRIGEGLLGAVIMGVAVKEVING